MMKKEPIPAEAEAAALARKTALVCPSLHFTGFSKIRDKHGRLVSPRPNALQLAMFRAYEWCIANAVPPRLIVLKARQAYGSTASAHLSYHHTVLHRVNGLLMADEASRTDGLWEMLHRFAEHDALAADRGCTWEATSEKVRCHWADAEGRPCESIWRRETANDPKAGAAGTWQVIWFSEAARYPKSGVARDSVVIGNAINAMPPGPHTLAILESTADGSTGYFAETFAGAVTLEERAHGDAGNGWIKVFSPWHECTDYTLPRNATTKAWFDDADPRFAHMQAREEAGREQHRWTPGQVAWRRSKILSELNGDEQLFDRDFPDCEEVAFGASAHTALEPEGIRVLQAAARNVEPLKGELIGGESHGIVFAPTIPERAIVWIWEQPMAGFRYLVAVDPMSGKSEITGPGEKDRHAVLVLRDAYVDPEGETRPLKLVARVAPPNQWDDKVIARWIALLSEYYGNAVVAVEANCGGGIIEELRDAHGTPLLHRPEFNKTTQRQETRLGWWTDRVSRRVMISELQDHVREQKIEIPCRHVVHELAGLVVDKDGAIRAAGRHHDDDAMALAMGLACIRSATAMRARRASRPQAPDVRRWKSVSIWS